jgi:glutathione S-transferase
MTTLSGQAPVTMVTFAPTLDSEQVRMLLRYYGVPCREKDHLVPFVLLPVKLHGGDGNVPFVYGPGVKVTSPQPIAQYYDRNVPDDLRLIPTEPALAAQFQADWQLYNGTMSGGTAIFAYYHLLPERRLMAPIFAEPTSWFERLIMPIYYPLMRMLIAKRLNLTPQSAEAAHAKILSSFAETDKRVADGRLYLNGDRMTLGDIALAAAAAPMLLPQGSGFKLPTLEQMPPPMRTLMDQLRGTPTAAFVRRFYSEGLPAAQAKLAAARGAG